MTKQEAKELSLEVWRYLAEHPEIDRKDDLPKPLFSKIVHCLSRCPLCELFNIGHLSCPGCPLTGEDYSCESPGQPYCRWTDASSPFDRKEAAAGIVRQIEAWEAEG
jgi:hypothetical protein